MVVGSNPTGAVYFGRAVDCDTTNYDMNELNCKFCNKECKNPNSLRNHERLCSKNPNRQISPIIEYNKKVKNGDISYSNQFTKAKLLGLPKPVVSEETRLKISNALRKNNPSFNEDTRKKISDGMKKAHADGRAHNIGECRWNNKPSYPEEWMIKVLKNEFNLELDSDYKREFPFHKYSLDFAFPNKKLCIEIDGEQHHKFKEQMERDIQKDKLLKDEGWSELREDWKSIFNNPKEFIKKLKIFFNGIDK